MKSKRIVITGGGGFIGSHLADFLREKGVEVFATVHEDELKNIPEITKMLLEKKLRLY